MAKNRYEQRGVSSQKEDVHAAVKNLDKGLFPNAFCTVLPDVLGDDDKYCNIIHADGAGTKSSLAYMYWKETGDPEIFKGIAQDAVVMNIDDLLCIGVTSNMILSSTIGRNKHKVPGEVVSAIINGTEEFLQKVRDMGVDVHFGGGETADVGDLVRTIIVDATVTARMRRKDVIEVRLQQGDLIVGLASAGTCTYEKGYNSGMGSNGLTSSRHDLFDKRYAERYPESFDPDSPKELVYCGPYDVGDFALSRLGVNIPLGRAVLSPTRTYAPIIKKVLETIARSKIHGIIHCSGGGQTKVMKFVHDNLHVIKDSLFPLPPLFELIQKVSGTSWKEMYETFNMGHRMELYVPDEILADAIIDIAHSFGVDAQIIGRVEKSNDEKKKLTIKTKKGEFEY